LAKLFPVDELRDRDFLDIGCVSGLSMLAALRLGARSVTGIDIDPNSAEAVRAVLTRHAEGKVWHVQMASVFDFAPDKGAAYDIVHSWGVLHHTGDMWPAVRKAAVLVAPKGHLALALYRKTWLCGFWRAEKKFYSRSSGVIQAAIGAAYRGLYCVALIATGRSPARYIRDYKSARGMSWSHDVHDWLGGYPYESVTPQEVSALLGELGFDAVRTFEKPAAVKGLFGSHCDEFVVVRR
jgi:SAM-dependent methyltransferase